MTVERFPEPRALERRYTAMLTARSVELTRAMLVALDVRARVDALDPNTDRLSSTLSIVSRVGVAHENIYAATTRTTVERIGRQITQWQDAALSERLGAVLGIRPVDARDVLAGKSLGSALNDWTARNVELVRDLDSRFVDEVRSIVSAGFEKGSSRDVIAKRIQARAGITRRRARTIARDQVGSLNSEVAERRQQALGLDKYVWVTARDERVRDEHEERHGKEFEWSNPPRDGHPGKPINCRCVAAPVIPPDLDLFS